MITEETLSNWLDALEEAGHYLEEGKTPPPEWLTRLDWLIFDGRRDIESGSFDIPGFVPQKIVDKLNNEIESYENDAYDLDIENSKLEDEIMDLSNQLERLKLRLMDHHLWDEEEEIHGFSDKD